MYSAEEVRNKLTTENIIQLCCLFQGSDLVLWDSYGNPIFNTYICHGGDSYKLYYYQDSKYFYCYTTGESYDIYAIVQYNKDFRTFKEAYNFVIDFFHIKQSFHGFDEDNFYVETPAFQCPAPKPIKTDRVINENILEFFYPLASPTEWLQDGIATFAMNAYGIRCDAANQKIIIPQRDINGKLVGIRGRSFNPADVDDGRKYMPVKIENDLYNCPLGNHLYGLNYNKKFIAEQQRVLLVEAEKSVLQMSSFYGLDKCYAAATCGFNISDEQIDLLLSVGVSEVVVGFDRDFTGTGDDEDVLEYEKKVMKVAKPLLAYFDVYIIIDYNGLLPYKASPTDCGQLTYRKLLKNKKHITEDMYW